MDSRRRIWLILILLLLLLGACRSRSRNQAEEAPAPPPTETPLPSTNTPTPLPTNTPTHTPVPPTDTPVPPEPTVEPTPVPAAESILPAEIQVLPTAESSSENAIPVGDLGIGEPGHYVNVAFGYELRYPAEWYTGFGQRPLLVSFSNLDPGTTNREGMRASGCLIEVTASTNTYNFNLAALMAQSPQTYEGAQSTQLGGVEAVLMVRDNPNVAFRTEILQVIAQNRLFLINFDYARDLEATCRPLWDGLLASWRWFTPDVAVYTNPTFGYSIEYPRRWFPFNPTENGIYLSSSDPLLLSSAEQFLLQGITVRTSVLENADLLPLRQYLLTYVPDLGFTDDINLGTILGVRSLKNGPFGTQQMTGYYQGPLGRVYRIEIYYPADRSREFRPIANSILYSFSF